jgi:GST-like protein
MIDLHTVATPNGHKVSIMLEETGLPYRVVPYNLLEADRWRTDLEPINPNGKLPAIVDTETGCSVFESGAVLIYLAEKTGMLLPMDLQGRHRALSWLMFQMAGLGPMHGQAHHFIRYAPVADAYPLERYTREARRLLAVMDGQLGQTEYLAGEYSIADIACWPWIRAARLIGLDLLDWPNLNRWFGAIGDRPAVQSGKGVLGEGVYSLPPLSKTELSAAQWRALFGENSLVKD